MRHYRKIKPKLGELVELTYPEGTFQALTEVATADRHLPFDALVHQMQQKLAALRAQRAYDASFVHHLDREKRERWALTIAWERGAGRKVPLGVVVVALDGNSSNTQFNNLHCLPRHELSSWLRFIRTPLEAHVARLEKQIMTLRTSEDVKKKLLNVLDALVDPTKPPDYLRQRAICETVQTLVGLLKVEVAYIRAVDGDGVVPFLEPARQEAKERRSAAGKRNPLLGGPPSDHPWRGLGSR